MASLHKMSKVTDGQKKTYAKWRGSYKNEHGKWTTVSLYTDKGASSTKLSELQRDADLRRAGVITPVMDHAKKPLAEHLQDYLADLRQQQCAANHVRNVSTRLTEIIVTGRSIQSAAIADLGRHHVERFADAGAASRDTKSGEGTETGRLYGKQLSQDHARVRNLVDRAQSVTGRSTKELETRR